MRGDEDDGQYDGESVGAAAFQARRAGQPWLRNSSPPWHMWGTTAKIAIPTPNALAQANTKQLTKVIYKRPETWKWLFYARLVEAPIPTVVGNTITVLVDFHVTVGLGRASVNLPTFERFEWSWTAPNPPPLDTPIWSTAALQPERTPADTPDHSVTELVAENIQVRCELIVAAADAPAGTQILVEVGSFFSPKNHVRPDWFMPSSQPELKFPGSEIGGS